MESQQDQLQPVTMQFLPVFLSWGCVTTMIIMLGAVLICSGPSLLFVLVLSIIYGAVIGLSGAWILINTRPRELRSRRRFGQILGFFLPILLFFVVPLLLGLLGLRTLAEAIFFLTWRLFLGVPPFTLFLIAGSILGGDWAAQRMEGRSLRNLLVSILQRG
jgi:hypothetical protein